MKARINRERKVVVLTLNDPRVRAGIVEEMTFEEWFDFVKEVSLKIARSHRA